MKESLGKRGRNAKSAAHYLSLPTTSCCWRLRQRALAKYLPSYGWEAIVLTPQLPTDLHPAGRVIETGYRGVLIDFQIRFQSHSVLLLLGWSDSRETGQHTVEIV
jgi:hypothetical protein